MNLAEREAKHNAGTGAKYTRSRLPVKMVYHEEYADLSSARRREALVKMWAKEQKEALAAGKLNEKTEENPGEKRCISVIGMNGVGKSNFGRTIASKLKMKRVDIDTEFRKLHGDMEKFIEENGWDKFRETEEQIVEKSVLPGYVVVLGGGAIESEKVRKILKDRTTVIWLQGNKKRIKKQLHEAKRPRPEFRRGITASSVENLLNRRTPHYEELATIRIPETANFASQAPIALEMLKNYCPVEKSCEV